MYAELRAVIVNVSASRRGPCRTEQPDLSAVHALLPDTKVVVIGVNIEHTQANGLAHLVEFDVSHLPLFDPVNELAGSFGGSESGPLLPRSSPAPTGLSLRNCSG